MRILKVSIGLIAVLVGLFIVVGEQLSGVSADAVVNARLTSVRAQIAGRLTLDARQLGALIEQDEILGSLEDPLVDDIRLNDLILEQRISEAELKRLRIEIAVYDEALSTLNMRFEDYAIRRILWLEAGLKALAGNSDAIEARLQEAKESLERSKTLQDRGIESAAAFSRARAQSLIAERELDASAAAAVQSQIELKAAREGIYLGEGYNDAPYSEQRASQLTVERGQLYAQKEEEEALLAALKQRIDEERRRVNRLRSAPVAANVRGRLWEVLAENGESLQRGQDILKLVDCDSSIVTLSVSENVYNTLAIGDAADFRMNGDSRVYNGTILRLAGSGAETIYRNLAVAPSQKHLERYDVALSVPELLEDGDLACAIGRTGRVFFEGRPLDRLRRMFG